MKSIFYKDLATPIFNSPLCGFAFGAAHHDICSHLSGMIAKGAAHRNLNVRIYVVYTFQTKGTYNQYK